MHQENKKMAKSLETPGLGDPKAPYSSTLLGLLLSSVFSGCHQLAHCHSAPTETYPSRRQRQKQLTHNMARGAGSSLGSHGTRLTLQETEKGRNDTETYVGLSGGRGLSRAGGTPTVQGAELSPGLQASAFLCPRHRSCP